MKEKIDEELYTLMMLTDKQLRKKLSVKFLVKTMDINDGLILEMCKEINSQIEPRWIR